MSSTFTAIAREMLHRHPAFGRTETITGLAAQTVTCARLATGGLSAQRYVDKWLMRRDTTASADRVRRATSFTSSSGVITHTGTAYTDTATAGELLEILDPEPYLIEEAIALAVSRTHVLHEGTLPTLYGSKLYWLNDLDWINGPGDIEGVWWSDNPVLSRNRFFEDYFSYNANGILEPEFWTIAGANATMARSTTQVRRGKYSLAVTRAGTDTTVTQTIGLLENGVSGESLRGRTLTVAGWGWSAVASQLRFQISDGVTTTSTSYHTGGSTWEELTATHTVSSSATTLTIAVSVETSNTVCYVNELLASEMYDDAVRRNSYPRYPVNKVEYQQGGTLAAWLPERGHNGQYIVKTWRPYPGFDLDRVRAGSADDDETDCPLIVAATGAVAKTYEALEALEEEGSPTQQKYRRLAAKWEDRWQKMSDRHVATTDDSGLELPRHAMGMAAARP